LERLVRVGLFVGISAALLIFAACGGGDSKDSSSGEAAGTTAATASSSSSGGASSQAGTAVATGRATQAANTSGGGAGCKGTFSGGVTGSFESPGGTSAVNTDYWFTEAELLQAARFLGSGEAQVKADIAAKKFVVYPLILNCGDSKTGVNFLAKADTYNDFPFGPKTYTIPSGGLLGGATNGEVGVIILVNDDPYKSKGGTFEVKKFDKTGIAGSFSIDIEEAFAASGAPKTGKVTGTFDMACTGSTSRGGCSR